MAAFAVAVSTRLTVVVNVAVCSGMFLLGLLSQYLFMQLGAQRAEAAMAGGHPVRPHTEPAGVLGLRHSECRAFPVPGILVIYTGIYAFFFIGAFLFLGMVLFQERQVA